MWKVPSRSGFVMAFEVFSLMQVIKTLPVCVIHWWSHFLLTLAPGENSNSLPSRLQSSDGLTCFVSLGNSHQWANHHMCLMKTHEKKKMADAGNHALSIYYGKNISFSNKNHTSLISQHERKQSRRWQKRREMQMKQQTRRTSETAARRENTDWAKGPEPRSRKEGDEEMQRQRKRRRPRRGRAG